MKIKMTFLGMLLVFGSTFAQSIAISGKVSDKDGPLPGVSVVVKGTKKGTNTDFDGKYSLKASVGDTLVYSYLDYKNEERRVGTNKVIDVLMLEGGEALDEIVVTSYSKVASRSRAKLVIRGISSLSGAAKGIDLKYGGRSTKKQSGLLTAKEVNDLEDEAKWASLHRMNSYQKIKNDWDLKSGELIHVFVKDGKNNPVANAMVKFFDDKGLVSEGRSDVFGQVTFYKNDAEFYTVQVLYKGEIKGLRLRRFQSEVLFRLGSLRNEVQSLDLMFTVDATGSMGDEMNYLKSEIEDIINRVDKRIQTKRVALTFYRDHNDNYLVKHFDFTANIREVKKNLSKQHAGGGGDYEEAVEVALETGLNQTWSATSNVKLMFLLLDAPPHLNQENVHKIKRQIDKAKSMGVKLIPIVASGANETVEYLMRYFGVYTNGTCVFITDDSGIGNKHIKPKKNNSKVEKLNDLILRLINKYSGVS